MTNGIMQLSEKKCFNCEKMNHFARKCRGKNNKAGQLNATTEIQQKPEDDQYCISSISDGDEPEARKAAINLQTANQRRTTRFNFKLTLVRNVTFFR